MTEKPRLLMAVFNPLDFDGRVQRSAEALAQVARVRVLAVDGGKGFAPKNYELQVVPAEPGEFGSNRALHLRFFRHLVRAAREFRPEVVYGHDFFMALPAWIAAKLSGARFVYDAHELIIPGALGRSQGQLQERVWYLFERCIVGRADLVIAANSSRAGVMAEHYALKTIPTAIRNISAPSRSRLDDASARALYPALERRSASECLCVYQGDVDLDRGLDALIKAARLLPEDYRILIVGGGPDVEKIRREAQRADGHARIEVVGKVPRQDLFDILRLCDVGVVVYSFKGLNNIHCAPNKVFEYAQAGLPIVATGQPPLQELVGRSGIGRIAGDAGPPTPQQMAEALIDVRTNRARFCGAIDAFLASNSWDLEEQRLRDALAGVTAAP
jgi:glycosyltransferase involved in cell wall biosynthesis